MASSSMLRRTRSVPSLRFPRLAWRGAQDRKEKDLASRRLTGPLDLGIGICRAGRATDRGRGHKSAWRKARSGGVGVRGADRPRETRSPAGAAGCGLRARSAHGHRGMPGTGPFSRHLGQRARGVSLASQTRSRGRRSESERAGTPSLGLVPRSRAAREAGRTRARSSVSYGAARRYTCLPGQPGGGMEWDDGDARAAVTSRGRLLLENRGQENVTALRFRDVFCS